MAVCDCRDVPVLPVAVSRKRSHSDMRFSRASTKWIDDEVYRTTVLYLYPATTESEAEEALHQEARSLGLLPLQSPADDPVVASSLSATTMSSGTPKSSITSQSTAPTSCDSSEIRPIASLSTKPSTVGKTRAPSIAPTIQSDMERKRLGFGTRLRKMTGFRKKKELTGTPSTISIDSSLTYATTANESLRSPTKSITSMKSGKSYFPESVVPIPTFRPEPLVDQEALQRTMESQDLLRLRQQQVEEKRRFLEYQARLIQQVMERRDRLKIEKEELHRRLIREQEERNDKQVEDLEARQLEEEMKIRKEFEMEKKGIQARLRHMEAYCQTPSPPPSPAHDSFRISIESTLSGKPQPLPERHITQQHYESLAQQYHKRDTMDDLHNAKINVLRGKQKRAVENFVTKKEREIEAMETALQRELDKIDLEFAKQEAEIKAEFQAKRLAIEARWRLQGFIEQTKKERATGQRYERLPDLVAVET